MARPLITTTLSEDTIRSVDALISRALLADGHRSIDEHRWSDAVAGDVDATAVLSWAGDDLVAFALITRDGDVWSIDLVVDPGQGESDVAETMIEAALSHVREHGGGEVQHWIHDPSPAHEAVARAAGLRPGRSLLLMTVPLPLVETTDLETRPFRPGEDEADWLAVNNAAFAWHPEQSDYTLDTLVARESEPWFDPAGFLLHERDGALVGFCWTKVHDELDPPIGEIYVIAVHPDHTGQGLGRSLVVAGLASIAERGISRGMLYVDADNEAAVALYRKLGFVSDHTNRSFVGRVRGDA